MYVLSYPAILLALLIPPPAARAADPAVKAWEETITVPAYEVGPNDLMQVRSTI